MSSIQVCKDISEAIELCENRGLYLKPLARLNVCVQLPIMKMPGKSISSWEVMEKLRKMILPNEFSSLKVIKTTLEFIRFEGEVENKTILKVILARIENRTMKLSGFTEVLKVKAAEAKLVFPSRHDWDSFFRDAKNMNEMKPGERPDTVFFQNLPTKWFSDKHRDADRPSEKILRQVFDTFGEIRCCDIPMLDQYHKDMNKSVGGIQTFSFNKDLTFEAYVQFKEYVSFVKSMDALRGMKLVHKSADGKLHVAIIKVDFDKTKHLSDKNIRKRRLEREKLMNLEKMKEERVYKEREEEEKKKEASKKRLLEEERQCKKRKEEKMRRREEKRKKQNERKKMKILLKQQQMEQERQIFQAALAERKEFLHNRRLQSTKLLQEILKMVRVSEIQRRKVEIEDERQKQQELLEKQRLEEVKAKEEKLRKQEQLLRERLLLNLKSREEKRTEELREKLRKELSGRNVLKSVLVTTPETKSLPGDNSYSGDVFKKLPGHKLVKVFKPYFSKPYHRYKVPHNK